MFLKSLVFLALAVLNSCAVYTYEMPVIQNPQVSEIKDTKFNRLCEGNVLFVNKSDLYREALIFNGYYDKDDLLAYDENGYPALAKYPVGVFKMGPADSPRDHYQRYSTMLVGGFYAGQEYTLVVFSKNMTGGLVGPPQFYRGRVATEPAGEIYRYEDWLGLDAGRMKGEVVNDVVYLPDRRVREYRGTNTFNMNIDVNDLVRRGVGKITNP